MQLDLCTLKWSLCPRKLYLVPLTCLCKFLPLDRIAMQQLSLRLRNTLLMVNKPFWIFSTFPCGWSGVSRALFFCALLVPTTNIFTPPANYLTSLTRVTPSLWRCLAHWCSSTTQATSSAWSTSKNIMTIMLHHPQQVAATYFSLSCVYHIWAVPPSQELPQWQVWSSLDGFHVERHLPSDSALQPFPQDACSGSYCYLCSQHDCTAVTRHERQDWP